jgi:2-hydroxy-3-keto-5-methylthiopentenyl-1-phosphate phosphatase
VDPAFPAIIDWLGRKKISPVILSDSFSSIITTILENNGIAGLKVLANELDFAGDRPIVTFPYFNSICPKCANCKTSHLVQGNRAAGTKKIYIGDGLSDVCPAGFCEILFAKGTLWKHYAGTRKDCIPFRDLSTVYLHLQNLLP